MTLPVIDLFAGPGGLGEGFSSLQKDGEQSFRIGLSIEKDSMAHQTLRLRSFFRLLDEKGKRDYYAYLRGEISKDELFDLHPHERDESLNEVGGGPITLGVDNPTEIDKKIKKVLKGNDDWVLIGGPPCQAYSLVGRSRMKGKVKGFEKDERHFLYREYLRIIKKHKPAVFIMENVKGLLSSKHDGGGIFERILEDLRAPGYNIYSCVTSDKDLEPRDYIINSENYGIPQARHRVILLGLRNGLGRGDQVLQMQLGEKNTVQGAIGGLPEIRSTLSKGGDSFNKWIDNLKGFNLSCVEDKEVRVIVKDALAGITVASTGANYVSQKPEFSTPFFRKKGVRKWYEDRAIKGTCNHEARGHMDSDIHRYLYAACFAKVHGHSPKMADFPKPLWPNHRNVKLAAEGKMFSDRFRVQRGDRYSTTVTSHISKDGHYFIHPDPTQCRSLTVREAARLQTFPDNYFFEGGRTAQYHQVGNAVPPLLARQVAEIVHGILKTGE